MADLLLSVRNWQDVWRTDVTKCTKDNLAMFTDAKGKQRTRTVTSELYSLKLKL